MPQSVHQASGTTSHRFDANRKTSRNGDGSDDDGFSLDYNRNANNHLKQPRHRPFRDHYDFRAENKMNDEASSNSSDSDSEQDHHRTQSKVEGLRAANFHATGTVEQDGNRSSEDLLKKSLSSTAPSSDEDEDTDHSVDTAMTTPTVIKHHPLHTTGHSMTERETSGERFTTSFAHNGPRSFSQTDRPPVSKRRPTGGVEKPLPTPPVPEKADGDPMRSTSSFDDASYHPFERSGSPTSIRTASRTVERPSQAYQERHTRRMSEYIQSPVTSSSTLHSPSRLSYNSATNYYEMLMAKFGRSSVDIQHRDNPKHVFLREETLQRLQDLRTTGASWDWDFWASVIQDFDAVFRSQKDLMRQQLIVGMPPPLRGALWQIIAKSRDNGELESEYRELLKRMSPHEKTIERDLGRIFPEYAFFQDPQGEGQTGLYNVIKAYSLFDQQVGYCRNLPYVVGPLLLQMTHTSAFCVLIRLMGHYGLRGQYMVQLETLHERLYQFEHMMHEKLPQLHQHLKDLGVKSSMYASQWFMTLFAYKCPLTLVCRVFDVIIVEGAHMVIHFALALMQRNQQVLFRLEFDPLVDFLNYSIFDAYMGDANQLIQDAYSFDISPRHLHRLAKQYGVEVARDNRSQSQEEYLKRVNAEMINHLRQLERSHIALEYDHSEVTQQVIDAKMTIARMEDETQQLRHQLAQARSEVEQLRSIVPRLQEVEQQNAKLTQRNAALQSQLSDVEDILMGLQLKYAESERAYETLRQQMKADRKP